MKLYTLDLSPNSRKVLSTLHACELNAEIITLDIKKGETQQAEFLAINAMGKTPVLADGDFILWESNAIMQYLADKSGKHRLFPQEPQGRANVTRWQFWESNHYGRAVGDIVWENFAKKFLTGEETDQAVLEDATQRYHQFAPVLEQQLNQHDYVTGNTVTIADFSLACFSHLLTMANVSVAEYPATAAWYQRLDDIEAWKKSAPQT